GSEQDQDDLSYSCIPIIAHGDTVGLLHIRFADHADQTLGEAEQTSFAIQCAEQISLAVANVRLRDELEEQSTRDPLTGLFNRRHFMNRFRNDLMEAHKHRTPFSLVSIDADHFKKMNDIHGHDAGDVVLRTLAERLLEGVEDGETLARVGGEEFCIILPNTTFADARARAEKLRRTIDALELTYEGAPLPSVTISCGVATADRTSTIQSLLRNADAALYAAKDNGRNQVCPSADESADALAQSATRSERSMPG
ncbi:MAG: sensor domain-containing diguanylate cyclase, partial [Pseudomonadota bacterium]